MLLKAYLRKMLKRKYIQYPKSIDVFVIYHLILNTIQHIG